MIKKTMFPYELIGEDVEIVDAKNVYDKGIKGKIIDETKETLVILPGLYQDKGEHQEQRQDKKNSRKDQQKRLLKKNIIIRITKTGQSIDGKTLLKKPEERIKG
ncbi:ribonuclease P protein subunit [Candidatus Woesearchaeota archaeon]|nr:ribonuclease P protein subunit [Candidatus Woesearchaeota archaeon]